MLYKTLIACAAIALAGCEADNLVRREWTIERHGRSPKEIQADFDAMAREGWTVREDNTLEESGHYVYFVRVVPAADVDALMKRTQEALDRGRISR